MAVLASQVSVPRGIPPYIYHNGAGGLAGGVDLDLVHIIAKKIGASVTFRQVQFWIPDPRDPNATSEQEERRESLNFRN